MPTVTINGVEVEVDRGATLLEASALAGFAVPHFCYHPALSSPANCRMCLVEVEKAPKLLPACYNEVAEGMVIQTESEPVVRARKAVLEFILVNHPVDCPICDKAGECKLQDYYFAYDAQESRMRAEKQHKVKAYPIGPRVVYDGERCILCTRCIRFCEEYTETDELTLIDRGDKIEVRTFPGKELDNAYSLCTVDICPVGALTSRDFRFKCRVWLLTSTESVCTGCSQGCNIHLDHFRNEVQRYRPRYNPKVNKYWMCDAGRLTYERVNQERVLTPLRNGAADSWHNIIKHTAEKLKGALKSERGAASIALVLSAQSSCEDLYIAKRFNEEILQGGAQLFYGGLPDGDADHLLINADKNPNRRGIQDVFGGMESLRPAHELTEAIAEDQIKVVYLMGTEFGSALSFEEKIGPTPRDLTEQERLERSAQLEALRAERAVERAAILKALRGVNMLILQTSRQDEALLSCAHVVLPACTHAEKEGTFVNEKGLVQPFYKAFEPHGDSLPDWQIFMRLAQTLGKPLRFTFLGQIQEKMFEATEALKRAAKESEAAAIKAAEEGRRAEEDARAAEVRNEVIPVAEQTAPAPTPGEVDSGTT